MKWILFYLLLFSELVLVGQSSEEEPVMLNLYPEGVYLNFADFLSREPSSTKKVEARDVLRPKEPILDPLIDNCYFTYRRTNKRVKDAFAISYKGSLFIHIKSIRNLMDKKDRKQKIDFQDSFIRVIDQGRYLYMEGYYRKGGGLGFSIGGGPVSVGTGGPKEELKGIVFDFERQVADLFRDCNDFNKFLEESTTQPSFKCERKEVPLEVVRRVIFDLNHL